MTDMTNRGQDCWLSRVNKIEKLLNLPENLKYNKFVGKKLSSILRSKFDIFWLRKINETQTNKNDGLDHNKLRVYKQFKSSFSKEPYIEQVRNRNQRSSLTRLRISAHSLATELGRRTRPITPYQDRTCKYCTDSSLLRPNQTRSSGILPVNSGRFIDTEIHFLLFCDRFQNTRNCFFTKLALINLGFSQLM